MKTFALIAALFALTACDQAREFTPPTPEQIQAAADAANAAARLASMW